MANAPVIPIDSAPSVPKKQRGRPRKNKAVPKAEVVAIDEGQRLNSTPAAPAVSADAIVAAIDEAGALAPRTSTARRLLDKYSKKTKLIASQFDNAPGDQEYTVVGKHYYADVSERAYQREVVDMPGLKAALGEDRWATVVDVMLSEIDKVMPEAEQAKYIRKERTGHRTVKLYPFDEFATEKPAA